MLEISHTLLNDLLRNIDRADLVRTARDIFILQEFVSIFALSAEATTCTQSETSASISLVAPSILSIYFDLEHEQSSCKYVGSLCRMLLNSLRERFGGLLERCEIFDENTISVKKRSTYGLYKGDLYLITPFLDGRFKLKWVFSLDLTESVKKRIADMIKMLVQKAALQLYSVIGNTSECVVEPSISDRCTTDDDTISNLPSYKRKKTLFWLRRSENTRKEETILCL